MGCSAGRRNTTARMATRRGIGNARGFRPSGSPSEKDEQDHGADEEADVPHGHGSLPRYVLRNWRPVMWNQTNPARDDGDEPLERVSSGGASSRPAGQGHRHGDQRLSETEPMAMAVAVRSSCGQNLLVVTPRTSSATEPKPIAFQARLSRGAHARPRFVLRAKVRAKARRPRR